MRIPISVINELNAYICEACMGEMSYSGIDEDLHYKIFNDHIYMIGYYNCEQWLRKHNLNIFEAIAFVQDYESENFGKKESYTDAEKLVSMMTYIIGEELVEIYQNNAKNFKPNNI
tara:strand:- start:1528 stop:1875 length:348 start_codon:yes stop_codon:yes gene_type:complete